MKTSCQQKFPIMKTINCVFRLPKASFVIQNKLPSAINNCFSSRYFSNESSNKTTCLYDFHKKHKGKMVPFAGFSMPVQYADLSLAESHIHTRRNASLFDVSHMMQMVVEGKNRIEFMESITVADIGNLPEDSGSLTLYTNDKGGIIDDLIVTKTSQDFLYVVSNAGRIDKDLEHVSNKCKEFQLKGKDVSVSVVNDRALLALQGPASAQCLQQLCKFDLTRLSFMSLLITEICGVNSCRITRCGYTGEDGFELSIPKEKAEFIAESLLERFPREIKLAGLGARDTLRLEAGLCLYGNDIDENTTPVEATLAWTISKSRRERKDFPGAEIILRQLKEKPSRRRVGIRATASGAPARSHSSVLDIDSKKVVGEVTSGCPSPTLKQNIAMCYVPLSHTKVGTKLLCDVRGKQLEYEVCKAPFVPSHYYIVKK